MPSLPPLISIVSRSLTEQKTAEGKVYGVLIVDHLACGHIMIYDPSRQVGRGASYPFANRRRCPRCPI